jgi:hypothetical protein
MQPARWVLLIAIAASAGCGTPADAPPPRLQSAYTATGEIKIGRYFYTTQDRITKKDVNVYRILLSRTWVARRGEKVADPFCRLAFPGTAPTDDLAMGALLDEFGKNGFFNLPRRPEIRADEILTPGRPADALVVETDQFQAIVLSRDLAGPQQGRAYYACVKVFEQLAEANRPAVIGVGVERREGYLGKLLREPPKETPEEPKPTTEVKPAPFTPEARRRMEEESRQTPPAPAPAPPPKEPPAGGGTAK